MAAPVTTKIPSISSGPDETKPSVPEDIKPSPQLLEQLVQKKFSTIPHGIPQTISSNVSLTPAHPRGWSAAISGGEQLQYAGKLKKLKRAIKDTIFVNGAICDEVLRTEEKLARAKEERRFLLRKLLQYQGNDLLPVTKPEPPATVKQNKLAGSGDSASHEPVIKPSKGVKRKAAAMAAASPQPAVIPSVATTPVVSTLPRPAESKKKTQQSAKDILDSLQSKPKKTKGGNKKQVIPPLMLDSLGRPVFPMCLGDITLHSIGEIVPDRLSFHSMESIYPAGYCITRVYASLHKIDSKCLYTCKISDEDDNSDGPLFEIAAEDSSEMVFKAASPNECHSLLLKAFNTSRGEVLPPEGRGLDFFGLSHPVIQNLIQSCPGARKCPRYKWIKFEINKSETNENVAVAVNEPSVSYDALTAHLVSIGHLHPSQPASHTEQSANLRSLLTKGQTSS